MKKLLFFGFALVVLVGCAPATQTTESQPKTASVPQYDPNNPGPWCAAAASFLGNPYGTPAQQMALLELMRNRGCLQ